LKETILIFSGIRQLAVEIAGASSLTPNYPALAAKDGGKSNYYLNSY
jgi:hypothetical protein